MVEPMTMAQGADLVMAVVGGRAVFIRIGLAFKDVEWMFEGTGWIEFAADVLCLLDGGGASSWVHPSISCGTFFFVAGISNLWLWKNSDVALMTR